VAGSGLVGIKRRIKSVTNTSKITKAMGLVATSKFRKTREQLDINKLYSDSFSKVLNDVLNNHEVPNLYMDGNGSSKKLYIVLTSDTGLCGAFNINIINRSIEEISKDRENSVIMVVGAKGVSYFNRFNYDVSLKYTDIPDIPKLGDANSFAGAALDMYESGEVGEIIVVYSHFLTQAKQETMVEKVLPLRREDNYQTKLSNRYVMFEPEINGLVNDLVPLYMRERILTCLINSKASEQATRMTAMDGATKNANQLLDKLKLQYNRLRQGAITQEISEIVGGAEAQK
jgi:F-type H+-transporting ATPase subunit gamma